MTASSVFDVREYVIEGSHIREYARATANSQDEPLLLHIKQYVPKLNKDSPRKGDLTVIGAHANGFPKNNLKELYEPLYEDFYEEAERLGVRIRAIWIADCAWQGRSGLLNENRLGNDPGWLDYSRDIIHMINTFRMPRPILAMGHSFGANALTNASLMHPRLFSGLILLEPVIMRFSSRYGFDYSIASMSAKRRDVWPSRAAAAQAFRKSSFYKSWDPRVLDRWIEFGLTDDSSSADNGQLEQVKLATTKHQEVFTFSRPAWPAYDEASKTIIHPDLVPDMDPESRTDIHADPVYRPEGHSTVSRLPNVRPGVLYVFGGQSDLSRPYLCREKLELTGTGIGGSGGVAKGWVKGVTHPDRGHLIPMEDPRFCARAAAEWAKTEVYRWWTEEREYEEWTKIPAVEKATIGEAFMKRLAGLNGGNSKEKEKAKI